MTLRSYVDEQVNPNALTTHSRLKEWLVENGFERVEDSFTAKNSFFMALRGELWRLDIGSTCLEVLFGSHNKIMMSDPSELFLNLELGKKPLKQIVEEVINAVKGLAQIEKENQEVELPPL